MKSEPRQISRSLCLVGVLTVWLCAPSHAAPLVVETFESGGFSGWSQYNPGGSNTFQNTQSAAHRDNRGFRFTDNSGASGDRVEGQLQKNVSPGSSVFLRYWFRFSPDQRGGRAWMSRISNAGFTDFYGDVQLFSNDTLRLGGHDGSGNYQLESEEIAVSPDRWYLIELAVTGLGTSNGRRRLWVDGQLRSQAGGVNFSGAQVGKLLLAEPYSTNATFRGTFDFDDVYLDNSPLPSRLGVSGPTSIASGDCVALTVTLLDSVSSQPAEAPFALQASLASTGVAAAFYSDAGCTAESANVSIAAGATNATAYLKATATGSVTATASFPDLLSGQRTFTVEAGAPPLAALGQSCSLGSQCQSGFCADGVCCNNACNGACVACSTAAGAGADGNCEFLPPTFVCRASSGMCDPEEQCTGAAAACPANAVEPSATVCRPARGACDSPELCTGSSGQCPDDGLASAGTVCRPASSAAPAAYCSGESESCPDANPYPTEPSDESPAPSGPQVPGSTDEPGVDAPACETADCVEFADLGCSCRSGRDAGLPLVLVLMLLWRSTRFQTRS